jgi:hypothetical protein
MGIQHPDSASRWRCGHCGNLTRFDVVRTRTVEEYWHFTMAGEPEVSEVAVASQEIRRVACRWCGATDRIEVIPRHGLADSPAEVGGP